MVDKFCDYLTSKISKEMPEVDNERLEVINYGIHLIIGELPKMLFMFIIGFMIGKGKETLFAFLTLIPLRAVSGGFHLKTHIGCFICSNVFYIGTVLLSTVITFESNIIKYIVLFSIWIFGIAMCILYAPADTDSLPILRKSERKVKKILSCIFLTAMLIAAIFVHNQVYSNMLWLGAFVQICSITRLAYIITNNKYGFETYKENGQIV